MVIFDTKSLYATLFSIKLDFKGKQTFFITNAPLLQTMHFFIYQNGHGLSMKFIFQYKIYPSHFVYGFI